MIIKNINDLNKEIVNNLDKIKTISIDFDGVIHNFNKGFHDGTCYGEPLPGSLDAIRKLSQKYNIIIHTAKAKHDRPLINGKTGIQLVEEWLEKYNILQYIDYITAEKPRAILYIDDNGYRHTSWENTLNFINNEFS
jgi:FMN phosphatase YigB (HAD superfamily)